MIYLRFSGTDTTLSHLFLPDLRPYTNRHDLRKKSLAAKKNNIFVTSRKSGFLAEKHYKNDASPPQEHPSRHPPDTLPIHENRSGRTTGQTGKQTDDDTRAASRQTNTRGKTGTEKRREKERGNGQATRFAQKKTRLWRSRVWGFRSVFPASRS